MNSVKKDWDQLHMRRFTPTAAVAINTPVQLHDCVGITVNPIAANTEGVVQTSGQFELPKDAGDDYVAGTLVWWDAAAGIVTSSVIEANNARLHPLGRLDKDTAPGDTTCIVNVGPGFGYKQIVVDRILTAGEVTNNYVDIVIGSTADGADVNQMVILSAAFWNNSTKAQRPATVTRGQGNAYTVRVADTADSAANDRVTFVAYV